MKYKVSLNNKESISIDEEGYKKLLENINSNFVILNGEVVNPSYIVSITKIPEVIFGNSSSYQLSKPRMKMIGHTDPVTRTYIIDGYEEIKD